MALATFGFKIILMIFIAVVGVMSYVFATPGTDSPPKRNALRLKTVKALTILFVLVTEILLIKSII